MGCCEFCHEEYKHRPQVKNPRACAKPECQKLRQQANEREWRDRNPGFWDAEYHEAQRDVRRKRIQAIAEILKRCLQVGRDLLGLQFGAADLGDFLERSLLELGVRQINKFWNAGIVKESRGLDAVLAP
jgi:hypothetical protein